MKYDDNYIYIYISNSMIYSDDMKLSDNISDIMKLSDNTPFNISFLTIFYLLDTMNI